MPVKPSILPKMQRIGSIFQFILGALWANQGAGGPRASPRVYICFPNLNETELHCGDNLGPLDPLTSISIQFRSPMYT